VPKTSKPKAYAPRPIATAHIQLTTDQRALVEALAANVHDVWGAKRIADGWVYGPNRDDAKKTHPGLVPYAELSEGEKDYDRVMVEQVIRAALVLGYRIEKA
jgi:RyR domain